MKSSPTQNMFNQQETKDTNINSEEQIMVCTACENTEFDWSESEEETVKSGQKKLERGQGQNTSRHFVKK